MGKRMYRDRRSGQLGELVDRHGKEVIRLDRAAQELYVPFVPDQWEPEASERPVAKSQVGRIAYEADRALCRALGDHGAAGKDWASLKDEARIAWISDGPKGDEPRRRKLYQAILGVFA